MLSLEHSIKSLCRAWLCVYGWLNPAIPSTVTVVFLEPYVAPKAPAEHGTDLPGSPGPCPLAAGAPWSLSLLCASTGAKSCRAAPLAALGQGAQGVWAAPASPYHYTQKKRKYCGRCCTGGNSEPQPSITWVSCAGHWLGTSIPAVLKLQRNQSCSAASSAFWVIGIGMLVKTRVQMLGRKGSRFWAGISNWLFSYNIVAKISPKFLFLCSMT